jgi:PAS domain S-box-containing protein
MDFSNWTGGLPDPHCAGWSLITLTLCVLAAAGYVAIAVNWYFQSKLSRAESRAATVRLRNIVIACVLFGSVFFVADFGWVAWRAFDLLLVLLVLHTWAFALRMRGMSLVEERLAHADEVERSAQRYREIAELLPNVVWTATEDGRVDFINRRWTEYSACGVAAWTDAVHPEEQAEVDAWWRAAVAERQPVAREIRLFGGDGEYRTFAVRARPIVRGSAVRWLGACADVEDQKRVAIEREEQARQKAFFLNALSHDLRAPLHNVVLNAHLLRMTAREPAELESVNMIVENACAAGDLVTRLLDFARAGEDRNAPERVSVAGVLGQVARRFAPVAEQKGLYLRVADDLPRDVEAWADQQKLERVVSNLVDNAIKFTDQGGITLDAGPCTTGARMLAIRVSDTGIGVPEASVALLFDEFYQVNNHERDRNKGFGIGLAICRSLARQLGGDVRLARTSAEGSCFEILVTAAAAAGAAGRPGAAGPPAAAGTGLGATAHGGGGATVFAAAAGVRAGRGGRPDGPTGDRVDPANAGLCGV